METTTDAVTLHRQRARWLRIGLVVIIVIQIVAIILVGMRGGFRGVMLTFVPEGSYAHTLTLGEWQTMLRRDPKTGFSITPFTVTDDSGRINSLPYKHRANGFLFVTGCKPCMSQTLKHWTQLQKEYPEMDFYVVPTAADKEEIHDFKETYGITGRFVLSGAEFLREKLNPFFLPRAYLFDSQERLIYIQQPSAQGDIELDKLRRVLSENLSR